jgi:hypothetical protein
MVGSGSNAKRNGRFKGGADEDDVKKTIGQGLKISCTTTYLVGMRKRMPEN